MDISSRLLRVLKAVAIDKVDSVTRILEHGESLIEDQIRDWERKHGLDNDGPEEKSSFKQEYDFSGDNEQAGNRSGDTHFEYGANYTAQVLDDLNLFGLKPPVIAEEIKKARNREIKKFHPDHFLNEPEKMETAKKILQIYNTAYERLKQTFR
jgi:hypothetical protein